MAKWLCNLASGLLNIADRKVLSYYLFSFLKWNKKMGLISSQITIGNICNEYNIFLKNTYIKYIAELIFCLFCLDPKDHTRIHFKRVPKESF